MVKDLERTIRPDGKEVLHGIDNLVSWESWDRHGSNKDRSVRMANHVIEATLTQLLATWFSSKTGFDDPNG